VDFNSAYKKINKLWFHKDQASNQRKLRLKSKFWLSSVCSLHSSHARFKGSLHDLHQVSSPSQHTLNTGPRASHVSCRDHSRILIGDSRGRVFSWSVSDQPGRSAADHWVKDEGGDSCSGCSVRFSLTERRHHCRNCGQLFCQK
jgi:hypothetical protein